MSRPADPTARISLLTAAESVFAEKGVASAKVEEIARRAHLSKGAFYLHFESKEDALRAVVESFLARCSAIVAPPEMLATLPKDPTELLAFCAERDVEVFEFFWQNRAVLAILGNCQGPYEYLVETFRKDIENRTGTWIDLLKTRGFFRGDLDTSLVSTLICGAYHELVHRLVASPKKPPIEEWVRQIQLAFVRGLGTPAYTTALERLDATRNISRTRRSASVSPSDRRPLPRTSVSVSPSDRRPLPRTSDSARSRGKNEHV